MQEEVRPTVRVRLASALAVDVSGQTLTGRELGSRKARTLLALLAAERGALVPLDRIVDALWPDQPPADPSANVATLVSRTRRLIGTDLIAAGVRSYGLAERGAWTVDLDEADRLVAEATARAGAADEPLLAGAAARAALALLGAQPALLDEPESDWVLAVRREAEVVRRRARHVLAEAMTRIEPAEAVRVAGEAVAADEYDEQAVRDLMRALVADGRSSGALAAYDDLVARLREELGTVPDIATSALHLAILRETSLPTEPAGEVTKRAVLVGREAELTVAEAAWARIGEEADQHLLVVEGEAGIGKTRLLEALTDRAVATGGLVLNGRCHPAERSLFLQPYVDALRPVLLSSPPTRLATLVRDHEASWVALLPALGAVLPDPPALAADVDLQRRQAYDAVAATLARLATEQPVLLTIDDLQDGGAATVDLLGYLAGHLGRARVLVVGAVRAEDAHVADRLADRGQRIRLGALPRSAVDQLAAAAGLGAHGEQVMARTAGHPLSVVECLRALAGGETGVPASLADAVLTRVGRLDPQQRAVVDAASVVRRRLDPRLLAALVEATEVATARHCEDLVRLRLLVRSEDVYEFANDLLQECVHAALPPAVAVAYHRRAAELTAGQPEVMAEHAYAAGDEPRAAHGWLLSGEAALRRSAVEDAQILLDRSLAVQTAFAGTRSRALLARSRVHEARSEFALALTDIDAALALARNSDDRRVEMAGLRARGGDAGVGGGLTVDELLTAVESGLALAADLGDRRAEADFSSRLAVLDASRLRLTTALAHAERGVARARSAGTEEARMLALDGLKTVWSYLAAPDQLRAVIDEMEPLVRAQDNTWLLQWVVFEAAFVAAAESRWDEARGLVAEALDLNHRSGFPAYAGFLLAHDGWFARLAGDLDTALRQGRSAVESSVRSAHPWWFASSYGLLAATMVEAGEPDAALAMAKRGLARSATATAGGRLRCLAVQAAVTRDPADVKEATRLLDAIECPPGHAWIPGADCYLLLAAAAEAPVDRAETSRLLEPLRTATEHSWREIRERVRAVTP